MFDLQARGCCCCCCRCSILRFNERRPRWLVGSTTPLVVWKTAVITPPGSLACGERASIAKASSFPRPVCTDVSFLYRGGAQLFRVTHALGYAELRPRSAWLVRKRYMNAKPARHWSFLENAFRCREDPCAAKCSLRTDSATTVAHYRRFA